MRNLRAVYFLCTLILIMVLPSCSTEALNEDHTQGTPESRIYTPEFAADMHTHAMNYAFREMDFEQDIPDLHGRLSYIRTSIVSSLTKEFALSEDEQKAITRGAEETDHLFYNINFEAEIASKTVNLDLFQVQSAALDSLYEVSLVDDFEYNVLQRLVQSFMLASNLDISSSALEDSLDTYASLLGSDNQVSLYVTAIAQASYEWWRDN